MHRNTKLERGVFLALTAAALGVSPFALAQQPAGVEPAVLDTVVVTGSRIKMRELESPTPITIVSNEALEATGSQNVADVLRNLPAVGASGISSTNSNFSTSGAGINTINLRNLGDQRTLVLVNGRRFTPGVAGSSIVDFNMIPTDFIDHIEVVTGGASAIYGSDAIAGVVNVIYKNDFSGVVLNGQGGSASAGGENTRLVSLTIGDTLAEGRGHFMLNLNYDKDSGLYSRQRARSAIDQQISPSGGLTTPAHSSYAPQGRFTYGNLCNVTLSQGLAQCPAGYSSSGSYLGANTGDTFTFRGANTLHHGFSTVTDGFNRNSYRRISTPLDRTLLATVASYDLSEKQQLYAEVTYGMTRSKSDLEPLPLASNSPGGGVYGAAVDANNVPIGMPITNPYIPAEIASNIASWNEANPNDPVQYIQFRKRLLDIANRGSDSRRQTMRTVIGIKGDLPIAKDWTYDVSYMFGRTTDDQSSTGQVNTLNFANALDAIVDPSSGNIVCRDLVARQSGCVPINLFGFNSITPAAAAYVNATVTYNVTIQQQVASGYVTGPLVHLPAGAMSLVVGAESRRESSDTIWDPLTNSGQNGGNALANSSGSFHVNEAFAELSAPILKDAPGAEALTFDAAVRVGDYSTVGKVNTWKAGLEWAPIHDLRLRGVYSRAVRAPNIGELFGGANQNFPTGLSDPCDGVSSASTGAVATACKAIPAVAAVVAGGGTFTYNFLDYQSITGFDKSNPALKQETAKTTTIGLAWEPSQLHGFSFTEDYFDIKIDDGVGIYGRQTSISQCLATGAAQYCDTVIRSPNTGKIILVNTQLFNLGSIATAGFETGVHYRTNLGGGLLSANLIETHTTKLEFINFPGAAPQTGIADLSTGPGFRDRAQLLLAYDRGPFTVDWTMNYMSATNDMNPENGNGIASAIYNHVPAYTYHDVQVRYKVPFGAGNSVLEAYVGAKNVFDKQPPVLPSGMASEVTGTETSTVYDVYGRYVYGGIKAKF